MKARFYVITYDLKNEDKDYMPLYDAIKSLGKWEHPIASTWIVNTSMNAEEISRKLHSDNIMSDNDILFVCQLKIGDRNGWMGKSVWNWIRKIEESESEVSMENLCSYIKDEPNRIVEVDDRYVDLGLTSGTLWADKNIGAKNIEDNGGYFIFNEVKKQGNVPTKEQFQELIDECEWTWKGGGYEVVGKNGNSIYLPAAGDHDGSDVYDVGSYGLYWSSSAYDYHCAYFMDFYCDNAFVSNGSHNYGRSVRLVK